LTARPPGKAGYEIKHAAFIIVVGRQGERIKSGPDAVPT
jgi:hypothetical protein